MRYRLKRPIMVLAFKDNHQLAEALPAGKIVDVIGPAEDDRFVILSVDDEQFHAFASDLEARAEPVTGEINKASSQGS
jgi:hypothetical protein